MKKMSHKEIRTHNEALKLEAKGDIQNLKQAPHPENLVLFSCVGFTDPIGQNHDGSILHICRVYRPGHIYLYLSADMLSKHDDPESIIKTAILNMHGCDYKEENIHLLRRPELTQPQKFGQFYDDFRHVIREIKEKHPVRYEIYNREEETSPAQTSPHVLLNVSSGTPAMKSAMEELAVMEGGDLLRIQVSSPRFRGDEKDDSQKPKLPPMEQLWVDIEENLDNGDEFVDRSEMIEQNLLLSLTHQNSVRKMISEFDYSGAYSFATKTEELRVFSHEQLEALRMAKNRCSLHQRELEEQSMETSLDYHFFPFPDCVTDPRNQSEKQRHAHRLTEYFLAMSIKLERKEYDNYIRATTPFVDELFKRILLYHPDIQMDISQYCGRDGRFLLDKFDEAGEKGRDDFKILFGDKTYSEKYPEDLKRRDERPLPFNSMTYMLNVMRYYTWDFDDELDFVRLVHLAVRNYVAHSITQVSQQDFVDLIFKSKERKKKPPNYYTPKNYHSCLAKLMGLAQLNLNPHYQQSYKNMNYYLNTVLDSGPEQEILGLNGPVELLRQRSLTEKVYPALWIGRLVNNVLFQNQVKPVSILLVCGVNPAGRREILAVEVLQENSQAEYETLLTFLLEKGFHTPNLVISDDDPLLYEAVSKTFPDSLYQRNKDQFINNVAKKFPSVVRKEVKEQLKNIWKNKDGNRARRELAQFMDPRREAYPKAVAYLEAGYEDAMCFYLFSPKNSRKLSSTSMISNLNRMIRKDMKEKEIFQSQYIYEHLVTTRLRNQSLNWNEAQAYISKQDMEKINNP